MYFILLIGKNLPNNCMTFQTNVNKYIHKQHILRIYCPCKYITYHQQVMYATFHTFILQMYEHHS